MLCRLILPPWAVDEYPNRRRILEGDFSEEELLNYNAQFYNVHHLPNYPSTYEAGVTIDGSHVDTFEWVFVDMDLKDEVYSSKDHFLEVILESGLEPTRIVDSGNGIHVYWKVLDLTAMDFLKLQRRLMRKYKTDEAVAKIYQLMRPTGFVNTKKKDGFKEVVALLETDKVYTCEELDAKLPMLDPADLEYCKQHYNRTYGINQTSIKIDETPPIKWAALLRNNSEVKKIWSGDVEDRSTADYRLGRIMHGNGFTKEEAASVLVNSEKARTRGPSHRINYAMNIVDKIWTHETLPSSEKSKMGLSKSVRDILQQPIDSIKGTRFPCYRYIDATEHGFRLGQVLGLVAGSGVGKTAVALNMFKGFVENNSNYVHFFIPLEQPGEEIAARWQLMCGDATHLYDKVHVLSNYDDDGSFRHLSLDEIKEYLLAFQKETNKKVGCVVIDHIGALKKKGKNGENQDLMDICHSMKAFAIATDTLLIMQSQAPREKAGIGDLELNKDAAYGTVYFESYCDYLITMWQPLKRCYADSAPLVTAFKFCKIRHKKQGKDSIQEDVSYRLLFEPDTENFRELTQDEEKSFDFFNSQATNKRKQDRKTDLVQYTSITWTQEGDEDGKTNNSQNSGSTTRTDGLLN